MAATLTLDTIQDAELIVSTVPGESRRVRTGTITNIDIAGDPDPLVLEKALAVPGVPQLGQSGEYGALWRVARIRVSPLFNDAVRMQWEYEPLNFGGTPTAYIVTEDSNLIQEDLSIHPVAGSISIGYKPNAGDAKYTVNPTSMIQSVARPVREIRVSAVMAGQPNAQSAKNYVGYVNDSLWPIGYSELPIGFWLMNRYRLSVSKYSGYYTLEASAITQNTKNWMIQSGITDPSTGKNVVPVDANGNKQPWVEPAIKALIAQDYAYTMIFNEQVARASVGWYPTTSFVNAFGFGG